jgi:response regulator RpfG family c-di-GMP phosphodiesterase
LAAIASSPPDILLISLDLFQGAVAEALSSECPLGFVILTEEDDHPALALAATAGAGAYLSKAPARRELRHALLLALARRQDLKAMRALQRQLGGQEGLVSNRSQRSSLTRIISSLLMEHEREGDMLFSRTELMQRLCCPFGAALGLDEDEQFTLQNCVMMANIRYVGLSREIASKKSRLSEEQMGVVRDTLSRNLDYMREVRFLDSEVTVLESMHERVDGSGFPLGRQGEEIPPLSRALAILLAYALLHQGGPHTDACERNRIWDELMADGGRRFDESYLLVFRVVLEEYYRNNHDQGQGRILLVEDHGPIAKIVSRRLTKAGYEVTVAESAAQARACLAEGEPDWLAILSDIMMPGESGFSLLESIKQDPRVKHIPVAMVSSRFDPEAVEEAERLGAFGLFVKPIPFERLLTALNALTGLFPDDGFFVASGLEE